MIVKNRIKPLKEYFQTRPEIVMAYIFGSYAKERVMSEKDMKLEIFFVAKRGTWKTGMEVKEAGFERLLS
ncbi:MAG: nucleotidyltransferase domain-containing protein [bacterium]